MVDSINCSSSSSLSMVLGPLSPLLPLQVGIISGLIDVSSASAVSGRPSMFWTANFFVVEPDGEHDVGALRFLPMILAPSIMRSLEPLKLKNNEITFVEFAIS
jgi:hypothetical protein